MRYYELLVSIFTKEIGYLIEETRIENKFASILAAEFLYQNKIYVKIIFIEIEPEVWVIHHELSREDHTLLKKMGYWCERISRIGNTKHVTILLSEDIQDVLRQNAITTKIKCSIQNFLNLFPLFNTSEQPLAKTERSKSRIEATNARNVS
ncbi:hypothetical protein HHO41_00335 [Bacillus sp. DNRA2]|uniref:hypothetical protein n=1 Tax=Bacillus sp. DNRA2 TaxID=2723053 RepID=UPI00145F3A45|nr:hypothetical protein [Bacillus sp. DNRA2]NMD68715.1 hypothetical protein [Bacillus sp. DNRA2]